MPTRHRTTRTLARTARRVLTAADAHTRRAFNAPDALSSRRRPRG